MSYLSEVLVTKDLAEIEDLNEKIQEMCKCIATLKEEVTLTMEEKYINYTFMHEHSFRLENKLKNLLVEMNDVKDRLNAQIKNELSSSKDELETLSQRFKESRLSCDLVNQLLNINAVLDASENANNVKNFLGVAQQLKKARDDLTNKTPSLENLEIFNALKSELNHQENIHSCKSLKQWDKCITWEESSVDNLKKTVTLTLATDVDKEELFKILHCYDMISGEMKKFADKLFKDVLCPIISNATEVDCKGGSVLSLRISVKEKNPPCTQVLNNLTVVFNFLNIHLNLQTDNGVSLFSELQDKISSDFCNYLIKNCLSSAVPKKQSELDVYKSLVEDITAFDILLKDIGFLEKDYENIAKYADNVEELFTTNICVSYLAAARNIMKKDLHDIKEVGHVSSNAPSDLDTNIHLTEVSPSTFQFPSCQISKSTDELLDLVNELLLEITKNPANHSARLFITARKIFSMYCEIVPVYHSQLLSTIPQQSAILHNNAMYLAHQLIYMGPKYRSKIPDTLEYSRATFLDLIDSLRTLASNVLTTHLQAQKKQIIDNLRDSGLVTLSDFQKFPDGIEKAVRQGLRQLALLQTVWQHILPVNTYCRTQGSLCNDFLEEIIDKVLLAEDIPAETASQLVTVLSLIQKKTPLVFPEALEIHRHVKKWSKFCELQLVLGASLAELDNRWADGKGPLAQEFTPEEVRHLVRALFQISDRRATFLSKIT